MQHMLNHFWESVSILKVLKQCQGPHTNEVYSYQRLEPSCGKFSEENWDIEWDHEEDGLDL